MQWMSRTFQFLEITLSYGSENPTHPLHYMLPQCSLHRQQHSEVRQQLVAATTRRAPLAQRHRPSTIQARRSDVSVSSWNGSAVPGEQLHTNRRRCWSSASVVRQSAEVDRSALSSEQFRSSVFCCRWPVDLEFAIPDSLHDPALSLNMFRRQLKTYFFAKY